MLTAPVATPPSRPPEPPARRRVAAGLPVLVCLLTLGLPAVAAPAGPPTTGAPEEQLRETRSAQEAAGAQLGLLRQSEATLRARLAELDAEVAAQQAEVAAADAAAAAAVREVVVAEERAEAAAEAVEEQRHRLQQRAVSAYVDAGSARIETLLRSGDVNELSHRLVVLGRVAEHDQDVLAAFQEAEAALTAELEAAATARAEADRLAAAASEALRALEAARAEQLAVQEALELRIAGLEHEISALAEAEDELLAVIAARASQPVEPTPTTTTAPTTTTTTAGPSPTTPPSTVATTTTAPPTTAPPPPGVPAFVWPAAGPVTSPFGPRPPMGNHGGIDIGAWTGDPIVAAAGGRVILAEYFGNYGNCVMIDHGQGYVTVYGHMSQILTSEGATVASGERIGLVGSTGHSTGPHLHFEIRHGGVQLDPQRFLP